MLRIIAALCVIVTSVAGTERLYSQTRSLTYLDEFCDPYYPGTDFPKLVTPQWIGEEGVDAVVTLGIDDMSDPAPYELFLRPILQRLKEVDGRAAVSIMTCSVDPQHPQLQTWLKEGLSIETHTIDHPCPCLQDNDFQKAKSTYDRCVDLMFSIPNNTPVAFRFPCSDSLNTPSPRAYAEIVNRSTAQGDFLQASSSVMCLFTPDDPSLPPDLTRDDGKERFRRYIPFPSFVNKIDNYPFPYIIGKLCWEFPQTIPDDWQGQNLQGPNNPKTVDDLLAAIDATVLKRGIVNVVFHPHGWIRSGQVVSIVDRVQEKYGKRVKFLTFRECVNRINKNLLLGQPVRAAGGGDNGVRTIDLNGDGFLDVLIGNENRQAVRIWQPEKEAWLDSDSPLQLTRSGAAGERIDLGVKFGFLDRSKRVSAIVNNETEQAVYEFTDGRFVKHALPQFLANIATSVAGKDQGVRLRDLNSDGVSEILVANSKQRSLWTWEASRWTEVEAGMPAAIVDQQGRDNGVRFADFDQDGFADLVVSNDRHSAVYVYQPDTRGFTKQVTGADRIPPIVRDGQNNGAWLADKHLWLQNEQTNRLPDGVARRSFAELLADGEPVPGTSDPKPQSPQ